MRIGVVVPFFNAGEWSARAVRSIGFQSRQPDAVCVIDDASTDGHSYPTQILCQNSRWLFIRNNSNRGKAWNIRNGIASLDLEPEDVIVLLDGDDFFERNALERIEQEYQDPSCWLAYGQYEPWPEDTGQVRASAYPDWIASNRGYRQAGIHFNHPETFRKKLWDHVTDADLQDDDGSWFAGGADFVFMVPMMEMAGAHRIRFIPDVIYNYNAINPLADNLVNDTHRQGRIRNRPMRDMLP